MPEHWKNVLECAIATWCTVSLIGSAALVADWRHSMWREALAAHTCSPYQVVNTFDSYNHGYAVCLRETGLVVRQIQP